MEDRLFLTGPRGRSAPSGDEDVLLRIINGNSPTRPKWRIDRRGRATSFVEVERHVLDGGVINPLVVDRIDFVLDALNGLGKTQSVEAERDGEITGDSDGASAVGIHIVQIVPTEDTPPQLRGNPDDDFFFQPVFVHVDRKSTRLNSSHTQISYSVFCFIK